MMAPGERRNTIFNLIGNDPESNLTFTHQGELQTEEAALAGVHEFTYSPRCRICTAGVVVVPRPTHNEPEATQQVLVPKLVNIMLINALSYQRILDELRKLMPNTNIVYSTVQTHAHYHVKWDHAKVRRIIEDRARAQRKDFVEGSENLLELGAYAEVMMDLGFMSMVTGNPTTVSPVQGLYAARVLRQLKQEESEQSDHATNLAKLNAIVKALRRVLPPETLEKISKAAEEEWTGRHTEEADEVTMHDDYVEAEVDEEEVGFVADHDDRDTLEG